VHVGAHSATCCVCMLHVEAQVCHVLQAALPTSLTVLLGTPGTTFLLFLLLVLRLLLMQLVLDNGVA